MSEPQEKTELEEKKKPDGENEKPTEIYEMKGIAGHLYLTENGEFAWVPSSKACCSKEKARTILEVLNRMPVERRSVWAQRLDLRQTKALCPIIQKDQDLCKDFDEFYAVYSKQPTIKKSDEKEKGGESGNE